MASNSKLAAGLIPVKRQGDDGVARTVYVRESDGAQVAEIPESLQTKRPLAGLAHVHSTPSTTAQTLGLGSTIEAADATVSDLLDEVESNPDLMEDKEFRDQMVSATGYTQVRSRVRGRGEPSNDGDETISDDGDIRQDKPTGEAFVDMDELKRNAPEVYDESVCDGETVVFAEMNPQVKRSLVDEIGQAEGSRSDDPETTETRLWTAQDEQRRCEQAVADYANADAKPQEGRPLAEQDEAMRQQRADRGLIEQEDVRNRSTPDMRNQDDSVRLWVKPNSTFTIYELHAKLGEMMSGSGDGVISDVTTSRQIQPEMYQDLYRRKSAEVMARNIRDRQGLTRRQAKQERKRIETQQRRTDRAEKQEQKADRQRQREDNAQQRKRQREESREATRRQEVEAKQQEENQRAERRRQREEEEGYRRWYEKPENR